MSDSSELEVPPPKPPAPPGGYLPRIRYNPPAPPPEEETAETKPTAKKTGKAKATDAEKTVQTPVKKKKKKVEDADPFGKPGKIEETPTLDTYDTRKRVRIILSGVIGCVLLFVCMMLWRTFGPAPADNGEDLPDEGKLAFAPSAPAGGGRAQTETEAKLMLKQARAVADSGNTNEAVAMLKKVLTTYPQTSAAKEAQAALDRPRQNLPLFVEGPAVAAKPAEPPPQPAPPPTPVVEVQPAQPSAPTQPGAQSQVAVVMPNAPAEPRKDISTSLPTAEVSAHTLPPGFRSRPEAGTHPTGWPLEIVGDRDGATMVLVPGGTFTMGRDDGTPAEAPAHQVRLVTYYIDQHEVTVGQYQRFLLENNRRPTETSRGKTTAGPDNMPMVRVTSAEARDYAAWAGKALPTEAQWEMAARTPDGRIYPWGPSPPAWSRPRAYRQIDAVMSFPKDLSPYRAYDLAGNAWEWTADWYDPTYYQQFKGKTADNPPGPEHSKTRTPQVTIKGGSRTWQTPWREGLEADTRYAFVGFRCALTVEQLPPPPLQVTEQPQPAPRSAPPQAVGAAPGQPAMPAPAPAPAPPPADTKKAPNPNQVPF